jgi:hypothetical protein
VKKSDAAIDHWMKELAPSTKLRKMVWTRSGPLAGVSRPLCRGAPSASRRARAIVQAGAARPGHSRLFGS